MIGPFLLLISLAALFGTAAEQARGPVVQVPRAAHAIIDGRMDAREWDGSAVQRFPDGTAIQLRHDGRHLFLGIVSSRQGFASVCVAHADSVRVFHASAALGSVAYRHSTQGWEAGEQEFVYAMRNPELTDQARRERDAYLSRHGWVASTYRMGGGLVQELQFSLARISGMRGLAIAFFVPSGETATVVTWPETLASDDGCGNERLVRGEVPSPLRFELNGWAEVRLDP